MQAPGLRLSPILSLRFPPLLETDTAILLACVTVIHTYKGHSYESRDNSVSPSCVSLLVMTRAPQPGSYQDCLWADVHNLSLNPSSPPYSPATTSSGVTAHSFPESAPTCHGDPLWSSTSSFLYESPLVTITLGRRVWSLRQPVYGFNGIVQGAIKLSGECTHVVRVEVSVEITFFSSINVGHS